MFMLTATTNSFLLASIHIMRSIGNAVCHIMRSIGNAVCTNPKISNAYGSTLYNFMLLSLYEDKIS